MASVEQKVKHIIVEQLGVDEDEVKPEASFVDDLGADSLDVVELVMALEEEFGLEISDEDAEKLTTVVQVSKYIAEHAKSAGRGGRPFQTAALLFTVLDDSYEAAHDRAAKLLGMIYNRDFRDAAAKYCLLGKPEDCLDQMRQFAQAGCRHFVMSALSDPNEIIERASTEMVKDLRGVVG